MLSGVRDQIRLDISDGSHVDDQERYYKKGLLHICDKYQHLICQLKFILI